MPKKIDPQRLAKLLFPVLENLEHLRKEVGDQCLSTVLVDLVELLPLACGDLRHTGRCAANISLLDKAGRGGNITAWNWDALPPSAAYHAVELLRALGHEDGLPGNQAPAPPTKLQQDVFRISSGATGNDANVLGMVVVDLCLAVEHAAQELADARALTKSCAIDAIVGAGIDRRRGETPEALQGSVSAVMGAFNIHRIQSKEG